ncbi:MAG: hypothetical protein JWR26_371 [Pedosphaera sp.]|nr:hypothetical protein [Pedosphaera sp.]
MKALHTNFPEVLAPVSLQTGSLRTATCTRAPQGQGTRNLDRINRMETQMPRRFNHRPRVRDREHREHIEMKAFHTNFHGRWVRGRGPCGRPSCDWDGRGPLQRGAPGGGTRPTATGNKAHRSSFALKESRVRDGQAARGEPWSRVLRDALQKVSKQFCKAEAKNISAYQGVSRVISDWNGKFACVFLRNAGRRGLRESLSHPGRQGLKPRPQMVILKP